MIKLTGAALIDVGLVRDVNEDNAWAQIYYPPRCSPVGLFVVCDGMGGHMGGEFASYWAIEAIKREFIDLFSLKDPRATVVLSEEDIEAARSGILPPSIREIDLEALVQSAIQKANHVVYEYARRKPEKAGNAGTTVTMAAVRGDEVVIANVGDSRTYLLRDHQLQLITQDHSLVASLIATGQIPPDEIYTHPQRNVIYRYLGQKGVVQPDIFCDTLLPGDHLLLCSDGFWEMVRNDRKVVELIEGAGDLSELCQKLVAAAKEGGGVDNISVVVVRAI